MAEFEVKNKELHIKKQLTKLDLFVIDALNIISKYADYVLISGYVSIFFGRARGTEDVDIFIGDISKDRFNEFYAEATDKGYEFNIENSSELYNEYLQDDLSINMWKKGLYLIRIEIKIAKKQSQKMALIDKIKVFYNDGFLFFSPIEYQIAYKKNILKSDKDLEDARHLEIVFKNINKELIDNYTKIVIEEF